ncbi:hypothetical protein BJK05_06435 [Pectobacterium polaris]|nr:hypothetical protein BJK05_06435 [Pectobacterium polaris]
MYGTDYGDEYQIVLQRCSRITLWVRGALLLFSGLIGKLSRNVSDGLMLRLWKTEDACFNHIMIKAGFYDLVRREKWLI